MSKIRNFAKGGIATAVVGAMALAGATPAYAGDRNRDKIDAGDVIAGALIIGGIAAIAGASKKDRYRDGYGYHENRYGHGKSQRAIDRCVAAVERDARRAGYRFAEVTEIRDVDRERRGWEVTGRLIVDGSRSWGYRGADRYRVGYGDRSDYRRDRDFDSGRFKCEIFRGQVVDIRYKGIRGLN